MANLQDPPIPLIDYSVLLSSDAETSKDATKALFEAFRDTGFIYLQNHNISQTTIDEAFKWSQKFFSLPLEVKMLAPHPPQGWHHRGYSGVGVEKVSNHTFDDDDLARLRKVPDIKESFEMGLEDNPKCPNIWLDESILPGFRQFFNGFYFECYQLELQILRSLAVGMRLESEFFVDFHSNMDNQTRILHYPAVEDAVLREGRGERIAAHSDFGTLTLLWQDQVGGLEIESPADSGNFSPVPFIHGTVVVNVGDFLQRWSNDVLRSTVHRVRAPPLKAGKRGGEGITEERYSIPYFCGCDVEKVVECLDGFGPKRFGPVSAAEYLSQRLNATY